MQISTIQASIVSSKILASTIQSIWIEHGSSAPVTQRLSQFRFKRFSFCAYAPGELVARRLVVACDWHAKELGVQLF